MNLTFRTKARHGYSVKYSPYFPQRLACASSQYYGIAGCGTLFVLDVFPGEIRVVQTFDWSNGLFDLTWAENNENVLVACGGDGSIHVWDVAQPQGPLKIFKEHTKEVNSVEWSQTRSEQLLLSGSWDCTIKLWDISKTNSLSTFTGHGHIVYNACWSPHVPSVFASASGDGTIRIWDARKPPTCTSTIPAHEGEILTCDWCKYDINLIFSGGVDSLIKGWDIRNPSVPVCELHGHKYAVRRIRTSPFNGKMLASSSYDFSVKFWETERRQAIDTVEHHTEFVYGLDYNMHIPGQVADCGWDELIHVYNPPSSRPQPIPLS